MQFTKMDSRDPGNCPRPRRHSSSSRVYERALTDEFFRTEFAKKNGQRTFARVLGSPWWLDEETEQCGRQFAVCMINFGQICDILSTDVPQRHANSNIGDGRRRYFSFCYIFGDFSREWSCFLISSAAYYKANS